MDKSPSVQERINKNFIETILKNKFPTFYNIIIENGYKVNKIKSSVLLFTIEKDDQIFKIYTPIPIRESKNHLISALIEFSHDFELFSYRDSEILIKHEQNKSITRNLKELEEKTNENFQYLRNVTLKKSEGDMHRTFVVSSENNWEYLNRGDMSVLENELTKLKVEYDIAYVQNSKKITINGYNGTIYKLPEFKKMSTEYPNAIYKKINGTFNDFLILIDKSQHFMYLFLNPKTFPSGKKGSFSTNLHFKRFLIDRSDIFQYGNFIQNIKILTEEKIKHKTIVVPEVVTPEVVTSKVNEEFEIIKYDDITISTCIDFNNSIKMFYEKDKIIIHKNNEKLVFTKDQFNKIKHFIINEKEYNVY